MATRVKVRNSSGAMVGSGDEADSSRPGSTRSGALSVAGSATVDGPPGPPAGPCSSQPSATDSTSRLVTARITTWVSRQATWRSRLPTPSLMTPPAGSAPRVAPSGR